MNLPRSQGLTLLPKRFESLAVDQRELGADSPKCENELFHEHLTVKSLSESGSTWNVLHRSR